jgi:hypothetical protein
MASVSPQPQPPPAATAQQPHAVTVVEEPGAQAQLLIFSHSNFFYWWPVWLIGYIMALVTWLGGTPVNIGGHEYLIHPSKNLGVIYTFVFFLVILMTNVTLRGIYSAVAILVALLFVVLAAYFDWWGVILGLFGRLDIYMNLGFYVFFSTLIFLVWAISGFVFDRMQYWKLTPGQLTHEFVIGGAAKSYDTRGMVFEKDRQDLFRHWILGLGSGDLKISTMGAHRDTMNIPNVLFVDAKVRRIQELIALHQQHFAAPPA